MQKSLGQRICIIGTSSTGKSTLAFNLGKKFVRPVFHLDQLYHQPTGNWIARPREEFVALHDAAIAGDQWVIEGNYTNVMPQRFARADTIIKIEMNRFGCLYRFVKRHYKDIKNSGLQIGRIEAPQEKFNWAMIWWILQPKMLSTERRRKVYLQRDMLRQHQHKIIKVKSFKEIDALLK